VSRPLYFASGSSRAADIRGFAAVGHAIGVAAPEVSAAAELELCALRGRGVDVFVDSGAFSEVRFGATGVVVVKAITDADWRRRLALYRRLAVALGDRVHLVAPDRIGDQELTLERLARYAPELRELRALGARILVPVQKGTKSQADFDRDIERVLGFGDYVRAIPSKKEATTLEELEAFMVERRPARVHLLGLGIRNAKAPRALELCAGAEVSLDSNLIAANVGRGGSRPRLLTRCRDQARLMIAAGRTSIRSAQELGIILAFGPAAQSASAASVAA
jgi:hypothetical protein